MDFQGSPYLKSVGIVPKSPQIPSDPGDFLGKSQFLGVALTRLSVLGVIVSVIQDPKRDPEARMVMGLLTPVSFPQPGKIGGKKWNFGKNQGFRKAGVRGKIRELENQEKMGIRGKSGTGATAGSGKIPGGSGNGIVKRKWDFGCVLGDFWVDFGQNLRRFCRGLGREFWQGFGGFWDGFGRDFRDV